MASQQPPLGKKTSHKKEEKPVSTSYNAAREELSKKMEASKQSEAEQIKQRKLVIESDEEYYDKNTFEKALNLDEVE